MAKSKDKKELTKLSDYEESLIYMSYRYAIGRHTIHARMHASDIMENEYERLKELQPNMMLHFSKDINSCIGDQLNFSHNFFIKNQNYNVNIYPLELYIDVLNNEPNLNFKRCKWIYVTVNVNNEYVSHEITYKNDEESDNVSRADDIYDLYIWNNVAKVFDLNQHHHVKLNDDSICEYVEIYNDSNNRIKAVLPDYIHNTFSVRFIPETSIKEYID